jgi:hypothetical protein
MLITRPIKQPCPSCGGKVEYWDYGLDCGGGHSRGQTCLERKKEIWNQCCGDETHRHTPTEHG